MSEPWKPPYADEPGGSAQVDAPSPPSPDGRPLQASAPKQTPPPRLFTPGAIGLATILGSTMAGALLYAWNLRALGRTRDATKTVIGGAVVTAAIVTLSIVLPDDLSRLVMFANWGAFFAARSIAKKDFQETIDAGAAVSVKPMSGWWCVPVAGACATVLLGGGFAWVTATQPSLTFGPDQTIDYRGEVTEADARRVGEALARAGYFGPKVGARTVDLDGEKGLVTIGFYVVDGAWTESSTVDAFACIAGAVHDAALSDRTVKLELLDGLGSAKKTAYAIGASDPAHAQRCGGVPE